MLLHLLLFFLAQALGKSTLGIDYGLKKIGLAVSRGISPRPVAVIPNSGDAKVVVQHILNYARDLRTEQYVVGLPLFEDGRENEQSCLTRQFAAILADEVFKEPDTGMVHLWDEFLTSRIAAIENPRKDLIDAESACLVLEHFFEEKGWGAEIVCPAQVASIPQLVEMYRTKTFPPQAPQK